ncbi:GAF domain-containing protein [Marinobacterium aestuariivivens]|uniref:GAF domain-containing protein n=1 Tax=Marinobacterium aestuariivivens TaxID=1698799 RepID=A0ABW1ZW98_9GAMM
MAFYLHSRAESHRPPANEAGGGRPPPRVDRERQAIQLDYLQELGELLGAAAPPQQVLRKVVEAVVESTGCDRAALCLLGQNGRQLAVRLVRGEEPEALSDYFELQRGRGESDFFFRLLEQGSTLLVADLDLGDWRRRLPAGFLERVGPQGFILSPLQAGQRTIGCLYADRLQGNEAVSDDDFRAFSRFFLQARLALSVGTASAAKGSGANGGVSHRGGSPAHS